MTDSRSLHRNRTYLGGVISYAAHRSKIECLVRNLSPTGAMIQLRDDTLLPDAFDLELSPTGVTHRAQIAWRTADTAGVRFEAVPSAAAPIPLALGRRVKELEAERDRLKGQVSALLAAQPV